MTDTTLCKFYMHGACKFGPSCRFSHDTSTSAPNMVCKYYLQGVCAYGDSCRYDHVRPAYTQPPPGAAPAPSSYFAPPVPKPSTDALEDQIPLSCLRLGSHGAAGASNGALATPMPLPMPLSVPLRGPTAATGVPDSHGHVAMEQAQAFADYEGSHGDEGKAGAYYEEGEYEEGDYGEGEYEEYYGEAGSEYYAGEGEGYYAEGGREGTASAGAYPSSHHHPAHQQQEQPSTPVQAAQQAAGGSSGSAPAWGPPAWQQQAAAGAGAGGGGEGEPDSWEQPSSAAAAAAVPLAQRSLCMQHLLGGFCGKGAACNLVHGDLCQHCQRYALHPHNPAARQQHLRECQLRHERLAARARSAGVECSICLEPVLEKAEARDRKFGLMACEHPFCLSCIRNWRQKVDGPADLDSALRTCPVCRTPTHFITPSTTWPATPEEKELILNGYKSKLGTIDCKWFACGEGTCPFGTSCFYRHAYRDGRLEEPSLRKAAADEGEVKVLQPVRLSDFLSASSAGQQLLNGRRRR